MSQTKRIGFIGAGRVGTSLGKYLSQNGFCVAEYYSRTPKSAAESAKFVGGQCIALNCAADMTSDIIFITVNDDAVEQIIKELNECGKNLSGKIFCHTSGSMSANVLSPLCDANGSVRIASLHMLLAVNDKFKSYKDFDKAFFTLDGSGADDILKIITSCGNEARIIDSDCKVKYHAAAVFASNFAVALADIGCEMLTECGFTYNEALKALTPLIMLNAENITSVGPKAALTGPAQRGDLGTIAKHKESLTGKELEIYNDITEFILSKNNTPLS